MGQPLSAAQRARNRLGVATRLGTSADIEQARLELDRAATDRAIDEIVARAPRMTDEQSARFRQIFRYLPDAGG
jgi:hypothetical protein